MLLSSPEIACQKLFSKTVKTQKKAKQNIKSSQPYKRRSEEEMLAVIENFFEDITLLELRKHLANLLEVALVSSNTIYDEASERDAVLCFCKQLEKLVEASSLLC